MRLFSKKKPLIKVHTTKKDSFSGWLKCTHCNDLIHVNELEQNLNCCPKCNYHYRLSARERIISLANTDSFQEMFVNISTIDYLNFVDTKPYIDRIDDAKKKSGNDEAVIVGTCKIQSHSIAIGVLDFNFMGGSMGSTVGERLTCLIEHSTEQSLPLVIISASGGARMQESIFSLMQMAKTSAAIARHAKEKLLYISVLTNPTTGGVTASFATLGDIIIAEPNALIAFAGPRVIAQTTGEKLPENAQKSDFLLEHGFIDCIVNRQNLKNKITEFIDFFSENSNPSILNENQFEQSIKIM